MFFFLWNYILSIEEQVLYSNRSMIACAVAAYYQQSNDSKEQVEWNWAADQSWESQNRGGWIHLTVS